MPQDEARQNKVPLLRQMYGLRGPDGTINGKLHTQRLFSDVLKSIIVVLLSAFLFGGWAAYKWYLINKDMPTAFTSHCIEQTKTEKELSGTLSRIDEGIKELKERRHR